MVQFFLKKKLFVYWMVNLMEITETLYLTNRKDWRGWLEKNYDKKKEIWLIYYKKHTKKKTIPYDDAVEEALCFGWIDSTVKELMMKNMFSGIHQEILKVYGPKIM